MLAAPKAKSRAVTQRRTNRVAIKRDVILDAALEVFSTLSFHGATLDRIAGQAGISKANLIYHFGTKEELYVAVLRRILSIWLDPLAAIEATHEPVEAIRDYIRKKMEYSRDYPAASRLFCLEIVQGAPLLRDELTGPLRSLVDAKTKVIQSWIDAGKIAPLDPYHLIFSLWAVTQHYADFASQIDAILGKGLGDGLFMEQATFAVTGLITRSIEPV